MTGHFADESLQAVDSTAVTITLKTSIRKNTETKLKITTYDKHIVVKRNTQTHRKHL